jgi:hypothetical protein
VRIVKIVKCEPDILQIVLTLRAAGRFARRLDGRQKQRHEYADNGNYDEKLYECKSKRAAFTSCRHDDCSKLYKSRGCKLAFCAMMKVLRAAIIRRRAPVVGI